VKIAFIGYGEAARAFTDSLARKTGVEIIAAYDIRQDDSMAAAATSRGLRFEPEMEKAISGADWIISAVTADRSLEAAESAADHLRQGQLFIDINSVSPRRKQQAAALVTARNARYLDMAVMAPVHPRGHATPVLLAGPMANALRADFEALGFTFEIIGDEVGAATAIKMVRSMFVKGLEALTVETLMAAATAGCFDRVVNSLAETFPGLGWPDNARYMFERTLRHGARRAAEMHESAVTYDELGFAGALADRIADVQDKMGGLAAVELPAGPLEEAVAQIAALRREAAKAASAEPGKCLPGRDRVTP
jgi:3-hydroxyisobutyrate dehydrogenase-like beta-hydroxyacid dehydrogenase